MTHDAKVRDTIAAARACLAAGDKKGYQANKQGLPMFIFQCHFAPNKGKEGKWLKNTWRLQSAARLNGLVMLDFDHLDELPAKERAIDVFNRIPSHMFDDDCDNQILYAARTCSGDYGLRLVCKADAKRGNIADNQAYVGRILGLNCDKSMKNADRTSFANYYDDIFYINSKELFTYENEEYDKMFGDNYRRGDSQPAKAAVGNTKSTHPVPDGDAGNHGVQEPSADAVAQQADESLDANFRNVPRRDIALAWLKAKGTPENGERHMTMVAAACDLRYICDNDPVAVCALVKLLPFVQEIIKERGEQEVEKACSDACKYAMKPTLPKAVRAALQPTPNPSRREGGLNSSSTEQGNQTPLPSGGDGGGLDGDEHLLSKYAEFWERLRPFLADENDPYALATYRMADANKLGGVFAAGTMLCTLLTRCWYRHFDGEAHRLNPQTYIIGDPASGKGEAEKMDQIIMAPVIVADRVGREAEAEYKRQQKERATSSKAQKGEALKRPEFCIRYIPSRTSNAVFFRRAKNAKEEINGEQFPLHLYTFDSELDGNTTAQSGGSWIGKHDIELKAFHNECTGVDFANADSVNEIIEVYYNSVVTGTPISLGRKVTLRNVNDGLCSRMAIFKMLSDDFKMIAKGNRNLNAEKNFKLKQWAFKFDKLSGELHIEKLVEHVYTLCEEKAYEAEAAHDKVLDYLRKRAVFYAIWFTVPRIVARAIKAHPRPLPKGGEVKSSSTKHVPQGNKTPLPSGGEGGGPLDYVEVLDSDLEFATLMFDAVIYWQDYFFGRMLEESWDNALKNQARRARNTANSAMFITLPQQFKIEDVIEGLKISYVAAQAQIKRWLKSGFIKRIKQGLYEKLVQTIDK